jgi:hypothetical protein
MPKIWRYRVSANQKDKVIAVLCYGFVNNALWCIKCFFLPVHDKTSCCSFNSTIGGPFCQRPFKMVPFILTAIFMIEYNKVCNL